jgi:hypothetical protein
MKTKHLTLGLTIAAIALTSTFSSCRKDKMNDPEEKDKDTSSAADQSLASTTVNDMTSIADEAGRTYSVSSFKTADTEGILSTSCATVTVDSSAAPARTITVNFGTSNCLCNDGRYRRGALVFAFTGKYRDSLTVITVTPQSYFVNDNQVTGTKSITNKGHNASNHLVYEINANIQIIKANGAGTVSWQSTRQREWVSGESTMVWSDDVYSITGNASGTNANGHTFTSVITTPLVRNMAIGCRKHFVSGVLEHTPAGKATRYIDYGSGACDDQATVTINGTSYTITLP